MTISYLFGWGMVHTSCGDAIKSGKVQGGLFDEKSVEGHRMYLGWADFDTKRPSEQKIEQAAQRFYEKRGERATTALVNQVDACEVEGLEVRVVDFVRPSHFWVGQGEWPVERIA